MAGRGPYLDSIVDNVATIHRRLSRIASQAAAPLGLRLGVGRPQVARTLSTIAPGGPFAEQQ